MATTKQNQAFVEEMFGRMPLDNIIEWIKDHLDPDDVFSTEQLNKAVARNSKPDDLFDEKVLNEWAYNNGFVEELNPNP